jgi:DNA-binding HxlR family transcriptional regulator
MKPDLYNSLTAFSNKYRMEIIRLLAENNGPLIFTNILKGLGYTSKNSSNLANHLKKLIDCSLVHKDSSSYSLTKLGKQLYDQVDSLETIIDEHNRDIMVRTSDFCLEPFDEEKIAQNLMREADLNQEEAHDLARKAKHKLLNAEIEYLTAPLIREYMNFILLECGKEEARHQLTRLGLPPFDVKQLLTRGNFENSNMLYKELGKNIMEQYLLLNLLPKRYADFYLSGNIFFLHPESWGLNPLEVVISGKKFSNIVIQSCKEYEISLSLSNSPSKQFLPLVINRIFEDLRNFFCGGVIITEFESVVHNLSKHFKEPCESIVNLLFEMIPSSEIQYSHGDRNIHSSIWEIWIEVDLSNINVYEDEINLILTKYHNDTTISNKSKFLQSINSKPNILLNCSNAFRNTLIDTNTYRDLPNFHKKIMEIAMIHNITFISPRKLNQKKMLKTLITPNLNPVNIESNFNSSILILDKIFINLPRIIQKSEENIQSNMTSLISNCDESNSTDNQDSSSWTRDAEKFLITLKEWVLHAINIFDEKMGILSKNTSKLTKWSRISKRIFNSDLFESRTDIIDYQGMTPIICSLSLNGLKETIKYFTSFSPEQHSDAFNFLKKILSTVSTVVQNNSQDNGVMYVLSQPHLDNYLQLRYHQDEVLLNHLSKIEVITESEHREQNSVKSCYNFTVFDNHLFSNVKKLAHNFQFYQQYMNSAFLGIYIDHPISKNQLLSAFKSLLKNNIHSFGFSKLLVRGEDQYFRYAGSYKPLEYYQESIQNLIRR